MWYDTLGQRDVRVLHCATDSLEVDRVASGTDFPVTRAMSLCVLIERIGDSQIGQADAGAILERNAMALLDTASS